MLQYIALLLPSLLFLFSVWHLTGVLFFISQEKIKERFLPGGRDGIIIQLLLWGSGDLCSISGFATGFRVTLATSLNLWASVFHL